MANPAKKAHRAEVLAARAQRAQQWAHMFWLHPEWDAAVARLKAGQTVRWNDPDVPGDIEEGEGLADLISESGGWAKLCPRCQCLHTPNRGCGCSDEGYDEPLFSLLPGALLTLTVVVGEVRAKEAHSALREAILDGDVETAEEAQALLRSFL